jgi:hypothetical protein
MQRGGKQMRPTAGRGGLFAAMMMAIAAGSNDISGMMPTLVKPPKRGSKRRWNKPHQGVQEKARRVRQMEKGMIEQHWTVNQRFYVRPLSVSA